jgi:hypothetical protein
MFLATERVQKIRFLFESERGVGCQRLYEGNILQQVLGQPVPLR